MEEIEEFKANHNGAYVKYNVKDLVAGLHIKLDKVNARLSEGDKKFAKVETTISLHK